jgi:hypothetical protein
MAKAKSTKEIKRWIAKPGKKRPGIHSKTKASRCKRSKHYLKRSRGQG